MGRNHGLGRKSASGLSPEELRTVIRVLADEGFPVTSEVRLTQISGGRSNETYLLEGGVHRLALRMPPKVGATPTAHDVEREFRITLALASTGVPVATPRAFCNDLSVVGRPFGAWDFVDGRVIQTRDQLETLNDAQIGEAVGDLMAVLAHLHSLDPMDIGLGDFMRKGSYGARQLKRWARQWELVGDPALSPLVAELASQLHERLPQETDASLVHGDYRIDNVMFDHGDHLRVNAVLDWELATVGSATADVAMMCAYRDAVFDGIVGEPTAWTSHRLPDVPALATAYEKASGASLRSWDFHLALAYFKIGVIAAGIDHRFRAGAASGPGFNTAGAVVRRYLELCHSTLASST